MIRTRFAPSPTGYMHIGNLRTALYEYLIAKKLGGKFILRIEDTDQNRMIEESIEIIYKTLKISGLVHDEGPDIGGEYGPYVQSQRKNLYLEYAQELVEKQKAYYCFCTKERLSSLQINQDKIEKYDRNCLKLSKDEVCYNLKSNKSYVIRQLIPEGETTFFDEVYGEITVSNEILEDQILIKSDGLPTYNFANVVDDHLMKITHVVRGCEYLSSTPKYNLLYNAFGWDIPKYVHLPLIVNQDGEKLSKRKGDASFEDLIKEGFLPEVVINYIALLGWSPSNNKEIFSLDELVEEFSINAISKSPSSFDKNKLIWMNSEYFKNMDFDKFKEMSFEILKSKVKNKNIDLIKLLEIVKSRIDFLDQIYSLVDFVDYLCEYNIDLFNNKKMKTDFDICYKVLTKLLQIFDKNTFDESTLQFEIKNLAIDMNLKNSQIFWPLRVALSGKESSPCGGLEIAFFLGKDETKNRISIALNKLQNYIN